MPGKTHEQGVQVFLELLFGQHQANKEKALPLADQLTPMYPVFPQTSLEKLPSTIRAVPKSHLQGCFCSGCTPLLWENLFTHAKFHTCMAKCFSGEVNPKSDHLEVSSYLLMQVELLQKGRFTIIDKSAMEELRKFLANVDIAKTTARLQVEEGNENGAELDTARLPALQPLGKALSRLFFGGCVNDVEYVWDVPGGTFLRDKSTTRGQAMTMNVSGKARIVINAGWYLHQETGNVYRHALELIETLLHELLHVFLTRFICNGQCQGTEEQKRLCKYLHARMYGMYDRVWYRSHPQEVGRGVYAGHGPAFHFLLKTLRGTLFDTMEAFRMESNKEFFKEQPLKLGDFYLGTLSDNCSSCKEECISHCYYPEKIQMIILAISMSKSDCFDSIDRSLAHPDGEQMWKYVWSVIRRNYEGYVYDDTI